MPPKKDSKGGLGHRDAMDFVDRLRQAGISVTEIRAQLKENGYSKSRISQLCPLGKPQNNANAPSAATAGVAAAADPVVAAVEPCSKRHSLCWLDGI